MAGSMSTFKRYEKKYMMKNQQYNAFRKAIAPYTTADEFDKYTICNIYYDTDNYEIIRKSMEKPVYKEKLRVRSYGTPGDQDKVFFELKKKYKQEVFKRRVSMSVHDLTDYLQNGVMPDVSPQVMNEISYFMSLYQPKPKIYIAYDRIALKGKEDESLRITFDENIRFRSDDLDLCSGDYGHKIIGKSQHLTEIKVCGAMPLWLSKSLNEQQIYPTSFSKYGYCYQNYIMPYSGLTNIPLIKQNVA